MSAENSEIKPAAAAAAAPAPEPIAASASSHSLTGPASDLIMWMPAGRHTINAWQAGQPVTVSLSVDRATAATVEQARRALAAGKQRPFFDFDHANQAASAWPTEFVWLDAPAPGVYARVEWSEAGCAAIAGKAYRAFSPKFFADDADPARITGAPLNMGGILNDPAFTDIEPLWAARSGGQTQPPAAMSTPNNTHMDDPTKAAGQTAPPATTEPAAAIEAANQRAAALEAKLAAAEQRLAASAKREAEAAVEAAVSRGAIPPQDLDTQKNWVEAILANSSAAALLAKVPGNPALAAGRVVQWGVQLTKESQNSAIEAYRSEKDPRKRGEIYAKEIAPILNKGDFSLSAANSLGTLVGDIIAQRALDLIQESYPWLKGCTTDFSAEAVDYSQKVITRIITPPSVGTYSTTSGYVSSSATLTDTSVTINNHKFAQVEFNANEMSGTKRDLINEQAEALQYSLGKDLAGAIGATILASGYTYVTGVSVASFARSYVVDLITALNGRKAPSNRRMVVLNSSYFGMLGKDSAVVTVALAQSWQAATTNELPPIAGANIYQYVDLPANSENLGGWACSPDAIIIAVRLPNDYAQQGVPATALQQVVTNPHTGLSCVLTRYTDHYYGKSFARVAWMYGIGIGNPVSLQRLRTGP